MINKYLTEIFKKVKTGDASERSYYPVLEGLLEKVGIGFRGNTYYRKLGVEIPQDISFSKGVENKSCRM